MSTNAAERCLIDKIKLPASSGPISLPENSRRGDRVQSSPPRQCAK